MKNYVCLADRVLMYWGVVGLEPVLILRFEVIDCLKIYDVGYSWRLC